MQCATPGSHGHRQERADVGEGQDVGQAGAETALDVHHAAARSGAEHGAAERHPATDRPGEVVDQDVAAAVGTDDVGVADADDVDVVGGKAVGGGLELGRVEVTHEMSSQEIVRVRTVTS